MDTEERRLQGFYDSCCASEREAREAFRNAEAAHLRIVVMRDRAADALVAHRMRQRQAEATASTDENDGPRIASPNEPQENQW